MSFHSLLIPDIRYIVYDFLLSQPHTILINQQKDQSPQGFRNLVEAFPSLREEIKHWTSQQKAHLIFGIMNPHMTVFSCDNSTDSIKYLASEPAEERNREMIHSLRVTGRPGGKWKRLLGELSPVIEKLGNVTQLEIAFPYQAQRAHVWSCDGCHCLSCSLLEKGNSLGVYLPEAFMKVGSWRRTVDSRAVVCTAVGEEEILGVVQKLGFILD